MVVALSKVFYLLIPINNLLVLTRGELFIATVCSCIYLIARVVVKYFMAQNIIHFIRKINKHPFNGKIFLSSACHHRWQYIYRPENILSRLTVKIIYLCNTLFIGGLFISLEVRYFTFGLMFSR